jgi:hypothetical protein
LSKNRSVPSQATAQAPIVKEPVALAGHHDDEKLRFSFCEFDDGGNWPMHKVSTSHAPRLLKKLREMEGMTAAELMANHVLTRLDMGDCPNKTAKTRLANQYDGLDTLWEVRIAHSESLRLFGRLEGRFLNVIWWDPKHAVWPEGKHKK